MRHIHKASYGLIVCFVLCSPVIAEVYKYQDENGTWHFSDTPPPGTQPRQTISKAYKTKDDSSDLVKKLHDKFKPRTPIEEATLSVVSIETPLAQGSGFFISENGYILTNRHVVKPAESTFYKDLKDQMEGRQDDFNEANRRLQGMASQLEKMKSELDSYKKWIAEASGSKKRIAEEEYEMFKDRYEDRSKEYYEAKKNVDAQKRAFESARSDLNMKSGLSTLSNSFRIILKDETKLTARLVSVSKKLDLALLKLDGHATPFLKRGEVHALSQGITLFAIGSPIGLKDAMTSGVVTRLKDEYIITDTQILPGNSGGPLINESGKVVGVNTAKMAEFVSAEGFGLAISINEAKTEFGKYLTY